MGRGSPRPAWDRRRDRRAAALLFLLVWVVYLLTATYTVNQVNDNRSTTLMAWSLGTQGTIDLPEAWRGEIPWEAEGVGGGLHTDRFPGAWLWAAPFHAAAGLFSEKDVPPHPALVDHAPSGVAAATATALGVVVSFLLFRRLATRREAIGAALVLAFATGTWSVSADVMWTHGVTHLTLALGLLLVASDRYAAGGLSFALAVITRPQTAAVPLVVGCWRGVVDRSARPTAIIGTTAGLGAIAMLLYSRMVFDTWVPVGAYSADKVAAVVTVDWLVFVRRVGGALVDPQRGILVYAPFLLVLLRFAPSGWRAAPWWVRSGAVGGVVYLLVQLRSNGHDGGTDFFGSRLALEALVLAAPLLLVIWRERIADDRLWRRVTLSLVGFGFVLHAVGATLLSTTPGRDVYWQEEIEQICADLGDTPACS